MSSSAHRLFAALWVMIQIAARAAHWIVLPALLLIAPAFSQDSLPLPNQVFSAASFGLNVAPDSLASFFSSSVALEERWAELDENGEE